MRQLFTFSYHILRTLHTKIGRVKYSDFEHPSYQPMGLFGDINFVIDPYSKARQDAVDFVLNANYGTTTLRKEAFLLGKVTATA